MMTYKQLNIDDHIIRDNDTIVVKRSHQLAGQPQIFGTLTEFPITK